MRGHHERPHRAHRAGVGRLTTFAGAPGRWVDIYYRRPHVGSTTYRQLVLAASPELIVTFQRQTPLAGPLNVDGEPILAPGSPVIWFTIPGAWHDIGRFYLPDEPNPTGVYANVLTPVEFVGPSSWRTTDLYLDVWVPDSGDPRVLDKDELAMAEEAGLVSAENAARAREEAEELMAGVTAKAWPPSLVYEWTLERAQAMLDDADEAR